VIFLIKQLGYNLIVEWETPIDNYSELLDIIKSYDIVDNLNFEWLNATDNYINLKLITNYSIIKL